MANGGLCSVREVLRLAYSCNIIDAAEFAVLYEENTSSEIFPYWKFEKFNFDDWDDTECRTELRFNKAEIFLLLEVLRFPDKFECSQRTVCSKLDGLCILLKRLAFPCRYTDMVSRFGRNPTELCLIFNTVLDFVYSSHRHRLESCNQPFLLPQVRERYAKTIHDRGATLRNCFGFVDGTLCEIARPKNNQRIVYNGHKHAHGIKFQSVVTPNGLIANLAGPFEGPRHDSTMLHESGMLRELQRAAWANGEPLCLYGDPAYPLGIHLQAPFRDAHPTPEMQRFNEAMSEVRVSVEWMFGTITNYYKFVDFKKQLKIGMSPVGKNILSVWNSPKCTHLSVWNFSFRVFSFDPPSVQDCFW